ncbi:hypothetical protein G3I60_04045 [Streptomyces sp. SID13666]|nr:MULTISPECIES: hypothetical protein [unclassified Streptomyces]NEA53356.1 hypothetical protein [Streptomyces sp. SID13666]NEA69317.1 hypothetical protein [Streptomyces sp. SID13588]
MAFVKAQPTALIGIRDGTAPDADGPGTTWLEHITDQRYKAERTRSH